MKLKFKTDLRAAEIEESLPSKLVSFYEQIQKFFAKRFRNTDCKYFFHSGFFIVNKLGSISLADNGPIYTGDGSSVEKDHPSSINTGRTMRRTIGVSCDGKQQLASCNEV